MEGSWWRVEGLYISWHLAWRVRDNDSFGVMSGLGGKYCVDSSEVADGLILWLKSGTWREIIREGFFWGGFDQNLRLDLIFCLVTSLIQNLLSDAFRIISRKFDLNADGLFDESTFPPPIKPRSIRAKCTSWVVMSIWDKWLKIRLFGVSECLYSVGCQRWIGGQFLNWKN